MCFVFLFEWIFFFVDGFEKVLLSFSYSAYVFCGVGGVDLEFVGLFLFGVVWCHIINCWLALGNDMITYLEATPGSSDCTHFVMFLGLFHGLKRGDSSQDYV